LTIIKKIFLVSIGLLIAYGVFTGFGILSFLIVTPFIVRMMLKKIVAKLSNQEDKTDEEKKHRIPPFLQLVLLIAFSIFYFYIFFQYLDSHFNILL